MDPSKAQDKAIVFYDIASAPPKRTFLSNLWKTRLALNFKSAPYSTNWVEMSDVESTRKALDVAPSRYFPDGTAFHTLPIIFDSSTNKYVGDTFDIALYLDEKYPDAPRLVGQGMTGVTKAWNDHVDQLFSRFVRLYLDDMPLKPDTAEAFHKIYLDRLERFPIKDQPATWDDCIVKGDERVKMLADLKEALGELDSYYAYADHDHQNKGPFLNGDDATYADFIVAGWLGCYYATLPADELADFQTWHNGRWGKIWQALAKFTDIV